jgi:hypothetical protein
MPGKRILLISPQAWGKMFVAKHHYAVELARCGHDVYFLNPPEDRRKRFLRIEKENEHSSLFIVHHGPLFPLMLRFRFRILYDVLMKRHIRWLLQSLNQSFDIAWCFEPNLYSDLHWFGAKKNVYHPVDELFYNYQFVPGKGADLVVSVTHEILAKFKDIKGKKLFINHGISREFVNASSKNHWQKHSPITIGYSGNLLRTDIDFETLKKCVQQFHKARFVFWGNYQLKHSNLAGNENPEILSFVEFLKGAPNVELKGAVALNELVREYERADIFIICYDIKRDQSHGTNYHKVMEFLSTGKVIVSNNITTYNGSNLFRMCSSRTSNDEFVGLLGDTIENCEDYNAEELQKARKEFAAKNAYKNHILEIESNLG